MPLALLSSAPFAAVQRTDDHHFLDGAVTTASRARNFLKVRLSALRIVQTGRTILKKNPVFKTATKQNKKNPQKQ